MSNQTRLLRLAAVALTSFALGFGARHLAQPKSDVAARVNGEAILAKELQSELAKRFGSDVLRDIVHQRLILQEATRQKIKVDPSVIEKRLKEMKAQPQVQAMLKSGQVEEADLRRNLSTLVPLDQLVATQIGADEEAEYLREHAGDLETVTVQHILVKDKQAAEELREEARTCDFAALARQHSLDERTKQQGGKLGELHRSELEPDVADALFQVPEGQVSEPFEGQDGFHLFKVVKRRTSLEDLRPQIREMLVAARRGEYLEELRSSAKIETFPPYRLPLNATPAPDAAQPED
jgi:parvulin-like peptidyl-prolyl isomerase